MVSAISVLAVRNRLSFLATSLDAAFFFNPRRRASNPLAMTTNTLSTDDADKILLDKLNAEVVNFDHRSKSHVVSDHRFTPSQIKRSLQRLFPKLKVSVQRKKVRLGAESPDALYKAVIKAVINANVIKRLNR